MPTCGTIMVHSANYVNVKNESDQGHTKTKKGLKVQVVIYRMTILQSKRFHFPGKTNKLMLRWK